MNWTSNLIGTDEDIEAKVTFGGGKGRKVSCGKTGGGKVVCDFILEPCR